MTIDNSNILSTDDIQALTQQVWESVLNAPIEIVGDREVAQAEVVRGAVRIDGPWKGEVTVGCSEELAAQITAQMFEVAPSDATSADIIDAVGEIANMIGGNVKALFPGPSTLSLPQVERGEGNSAALADGTQVTWEFVTGGERFIVTITPAADQADAADVAGDAQ